MSGDLTARDVIASAVAENHERGIRPTTDAVLAALAAAGWRLERDDQWEWNVREQWGALLLNESVSEDEARGWLQSKFPRTLVRRRPAGEWEVAPDA